MSTFEQVFSFRIAQRSVVISSDSLSMVFIFTFISNCCLFAGDAPLILDGDNLKLLTLKINGSPVSVRSALVAFCLLTIHVDEIFSLFRFDILRSFL
jgi:hypothetical protein